MSNSACNTPFAQCSDTLYEMQWRILYSQRDVLLFRSPGSGSFPFICAVSSEPSSFLYEGSLCTLFLLISSFVKQLLVTPSISSNSGVALDEGGGGSSTCFRIFVGWTFGTL